MRLRLLLYICPTHDSTEPNKVTFVFCIGNIEAQRNRGRQSSPQGDALELFLLSSIAQTNITVNILANRPVPVHSAPTPLSGSKK